jgi:hypothetical protein
VTLSASTALIAANAGIIAHADPVELETFVSLVPTGTAAWREINSRILDVLNVIPTPEQR